MAEKLDAECDIVDLKHDRPDPAEYEVVIIGGSVYAGRIQREIRSFCEKHRSILAGKTVGLYISCLYVDDKAREELEANYPDWLRAHASAADWLGGRTTLDKMTGIDRFLYKKIAKVDTDTNAIREDRIEAFCGTLNDAMNT